MATKVGAFVVGSVSLVPFKQSFENFKRLGDIGQLRAKVERLRESGDAAEADIERMNQIIWAMYEKRGTA